VCHSARVALEVMDKNLVHFIIERLGFDVLKRVLAPQSTWREQENDKE
jgi:hypothetical protein